MRRIVLLSAILCLSGCSDRPFRPGEEVLTFMPPPGPGSRLKPSHHVYALASWDEDRPARWIPVGTRLRIASESPEGKVMVYVLEGEYAGQAFAVSRLCLRRP